MGPHRKSGSAQRKNEYRAEEMDDAPLTPEEIARIKKFFLLLDKWDREIEDD